MTTSSPLHPLLLLADTALPLGSFAFSSGLESFLGHSKSQHRISATKISAVDSFIEHSLANMASTSLPYVLAAYRHPRRLEDLDNDFDASTPCTVARRASVSQGRALLGVWERALILSTGQTEEARKAAETIVLFATTVKAAEKDAFGLPLNAHFPPLFGCVCAALAISELDTAYVFLLNHAKAVLSAAVRTSVMGPYQSQAILASDRLQVWIRKCIEREQLKDVEDACVTVPTMDLWMGRHELLYSRIFNS
ncbi:hypothetical protein M433DRAFT_205774 [Acidomyces richmondensis BFW]|nr:MAG: hypothetical protein FE78DRAFT_146692 [Acidomyces sp. 'richmondensis']KYG49988.1 hypothetical protein M433DRAFT_205774 [Acidomyces richmondensis BFW]